mmetsp:Transcript_20270/g.33139  ORF Transcript_20270/g.33139 Transcript_20270/m.33139 type:complete len:195 (+) Transcript_20270:114-698(+)|eukprot:scaffold5903_cov81-Skeletonema_menzelii.AAC.7
MTNKPQSNSLHKFRIRKPTPSVPALRGGAIRVPEPMDVLSGRGGAVNSHEGNRRFRELVNHMKAEYLKETTQKNQKTQIAANIVWTIRNSQSLGPGRFLKQDQETGMWYEIGDKAAFRKTGQALRENSAKFMQSWAEKIASSNMIELAFNQHNHAPQQTCMDPQPQICNLTGVDVVATSAMMPTEFQSVALVTD